MGQGQPGLVCSDGENKDVCFQKLGSGGKYQHVETTHLKKLTLNDSFLNSIILMLTIQFCKCSFI